MKSTKSTLNPFPLDPAVPSNRKYDWGMTSGCLAPSQTVWGSIGINVDRSIHICTTAMFYVFLYWLLQCHDTVKDIGMVNIIHGCIQWYYIGQYHGSTLTMSSYHDTILSWNLHDLMLFHFHVFPETSLRSELFELVIAKTIHRFAGLHCIIYVISCLNTCLRANHPINAFPIRLISSGIYLYI